VVKAGSRPDEVNDLPAAVGLVVYSASNRNEYHNFFLGNPELYYI
jgi:hypothetical protein